jgi:hypothetical protein
MYNHCTQSGSESTSADLARLRAYIFYYRFLDHVNSDRRTHQPRGVSSPERVVSSDHTFTQAQLNLVPFSASTSTEMSQVHP